MDRHPTSNERGAQPEGGVAEATCDCHVGAQLEGRDHRVRTDVRVGRDEFLRVFRKRAAAFTCHEVEARHLLEHVITGDSGHLPHRTGRHVGGDRVRPARLGDVQISSSDFVEADQGAIELIPAH